MIRRPPRSTLDRSSAASDVYKRQTEDIAEHAISWMQMQRSVDPARPFFVYFAPGATHAPLQPPATWAERYRGKFDQGWDLSLIHI